MKNVIILILILFNNMNFAQTGIKLHGTVKDENNIPLQYVNVFILNSFEGSMTDENGNFSFLTKQKNKIELIAGMVGYKKYSVSIELNNLNDNSINIVLQNNAISTNEVIVTASSFGSEKGKGVVMTSIDVLTTPGGAADIFQALKTMPGLTPVSESAQLYVRGGDPIETLTLLDQATLYHPYTYESSYGGLFSNINSENIIGMYFSSGGFSAKYGNALSGVLDLKSNNEPLKSLYKIGLSMASAEINASTPIFNDKLGFRFSARNSFTEPVFWLNGKNSSFTNQPSSKDFTSNLIYKYSLTGRLKTIFSYATDKQGVIINQPGYTDEFKGNSNNYIINTQISDLLFNNLVVKTSISFSEFNRKWQLGLLDLDKIDNNLKLRSDFEMPFQPFKLNMGYEIENRNTSFIGIIPIEDYDMRKNGQAKVINSTFGITRYGLYIETEVPNVFNIIGLSVIAGIRSDNIPKLKIYTLDPRANIGYKINDKVSIAFGCGLFHQHPDPRLYSPIDGNPSLKSMQSIHLVSSLNYSFSERDEFRVEFYYKKYNNLPLEDNNLFYNNKGFGFAKGIDIIVKGILFNKIDSYFVWVYYNQTKMDGL